MKGCVRSSSTNVRVSAPSVVWPTRSSRLVSSGPRTRAATSSSFGGSHVNRSIALARMKSSGWVSPSEPWLYCLRISSDRKSTRLNSSHSLPTLFRSEKLIHQCPRQRAERGLADQVEPLGVERSSHQGGDLVELRGIARQQVDRLGANEELRVGQPFRALVILLEDFVRSEEHTSELQSLPTDALPI